MAIAKWYKIDFHTHTPASDCFRDRNVTAEQWLTSAKNAGLDAVVITDHNSVGFISKIDEIQRNEATRVNIKVFYGIELCVSADFIHIIVIFDDSLSVIEIEDAVISELELKRGDWGNTEKNVEEDKLRKLCERFRGRIFVIPAHFNSSKGLNEAKVNELKKFKENIPFSAVEVRNDDDVYAYRKRLKDGLIDEVALVTGSDNPSIKDESIHSVEGFGKAFTWIKVSTLSFDGLRQVFIDYEHRCINHVDLKKLGLDYNPNVIAHNYISGIELSGFLHMENISLRFSPYLNCIVGGRGTGKSTLVDAICYGLKKNKELDSNNVVEKTFSDGGILKTYYNFGTECEYLIECNKTNSELTYSVINQEEIVVPEPPEFKIDFYGQGDIISLVEDEGGSETRKRGAQKLYQENPLLNKIDGTISTKLFDINDSIKHSIERMIGLSANYRNTVDKLAELPSVVAEIGKAESLLSQYKASGLEEARGRLESIDRCIKTTRAKGGEYLHLINELISTFERKRDDFSMESVRLNNEQVVNSDALRLFEALLTSCDNIIDKLLEELERTENSINEFNESDIHAKRTELERIYFEAAKKIENTGASDVRAIQEKLLENRTRKNELMILRLDQEALLKEIDHAIDSFIEALSKLTKAREDALAKIETDGIKISIKSLGNVRRWKTQLQKNFGKDSFEDDFLKVAEEILNDTEKKDKYRHFLRFLLTSDTGDLSELGIEGCSTRFLNIWKNRVKDNTLHSICSIIPEDKIEIKIDQAGGDIDISEGSPGQQCAALLTLLLNIGDDPLIIDQPEDALDNSLIYKLIVKSIRAMKEHRQIIIVSHNPNIPVLGDAEGVIIFARNSNGKVDFREGKKTGGIEEKIIRRGICEIMEGGEEAFRKREEKYLYFLDK